MANHFKVAILETPEEQQHRLRKAITAHTKERLKMLYWVKSRLVSTRSELAQQIKRVRSGKGRKSLLKTFC
jgi:hypothetical protein